MSALVAGALRRDRLVVVSSLLTVVALSWAYVLIGAGMSMHEMDSMLVAAHREPWTLGYAGLMLVMWGVMMAAMMLPSAAPMILLYGTIARRRASGDHATGSALFAVGYVAVWAVFSLAAAGVQFGLEEAALLSPMMATTSVAVAGILLIAAGLYQWTPLKQACLRRCRSPLEFLVTQWRTGPGGALAMGVRHGGYCLGCCWLLMLLLFVGGIMNLAWIAGLAMFVIIEKLAPAGHWIGRVAGAVLILWGGVTLVAL